jgi:hypothetical protein
LIKIAIYLSLSLHKECPSYRRSLQPSKENILHFKRRNLLLNSFFLFFWAIYALLDPIKSGSGSKTPVKDDLPLLLSNYLWMGLTWGVNVLHDPAEASSSARNTAGIVLQQQEHSITRTVR